MAPPLFRQWFFDCLLKNGRAVIYPVYKGTFERNDGLEIGTRLSHQYTDWMIKWVKDLSRSIDYLETRADIDTSKIGYLGHSWGGRLGGLIPAVEHRIKLSVLITGGIGGDQSYPEADPFNYIPRINTPVLMLNGKYDATFPFESTVQPFYDLLGTPEPDKRLVVTETDHWIPKQDFIRETLDWMDKYFGPVK
ncbi:MAG: dienelactone hydrolase family protein [Bacteroidales bacterium]|nr:dienelactone hydrolase family protein [Bacteroidales bacterium]